MSTVSASLLASRFLPWLRCALEPINLNVPVALGHGFITSIESKFGQVLFYTLRGTVTVVWVPAVLTVWRLEIQSHGVSKIDTFEDFQSLVCTGIYT